MSKVVSDAGVLLAPTLGELLAAERTQRGHLLSPWLREGESLMVYAPTGCGKSMLVLSLAIAIAGGGSVLGWKAPKPRKVLIVDGEMPEDDTTDRARCLMGGIEELDREAAGQNLRIISQQAQPIECVFPNLSDPEGQEWILKEAMRHNAELVILDNFSTLAECSDENSSASFNGIIRFLKRMKQAGIGVLLVHHSGKGAKAETYRGSSRLATTFEVIIGLAPDEETREGGVLSFRLNWDKYRGNRKSAGEALTVTAQEDDHGQLVWSSGEAIPRCLREMMTEAKTFNHTTQGSLAKALGISAGELSKRKRQALHMGLMTEKDWSNWIGSEGSGRSRKGFPESDF
ncbi:MAG: hypothetical protein DI561_03590 [Thauera sp.]|nr:MAG: hypothetical protein DI561_03590 [Thauera sp.]